MDDQFLSTDRLTITGPTTKRPRLLPVTNTWTAAHDRLEDAIQEYIDISLKINSFCSPNCHADVPSLISSSPHNDVDYRLQSLAARIPNLFRALSSVASARNRCHKNTSINKLPREILSYILHLVVTSELHNLREPDLDDETSAKDQRREMVRIVSYPSILSAVCRTWHDLVLRTPVLWSYIDLMSPEDSPKCSYARANLFVSRAANYRLDVRIHGSLFYQPMDEVVKWLTSIMPRVRCLELLDGWIDGVMPILCCWAQHASPGIMKAFNLRHVNSFGTNTRLLLPEFAEQHPELAISPERLAEITRSITYLTLSGGFFDWNSQAYHELTSLELNDGCITTTAVHTVLINNPRLRVLSLGLHIIGDEGNPEPAPVCLPHLETLAVVSRSLPDCPLFRMIAPAPNLHKLVLGCDWIAEAKTKLGDITEFLRRSAITALYISQWSYLIFDLLCLLPLPHLQRLGLRDYVSLDVCDIYSFNPEVFPQLRELCFIEGDMNVGWLEGILRSYPTMALRISDVRMWKDGSQMKPEETLQKLSKMFPDVKWNYRDVICDWDPRLAWDFANFD